MVFFLLSAFRSEAHQPSSHGDMRAPFKEPRPPLAELRHKSNPFKRLRRRRRRRRQTPPLPLRSKKLVRDQSTPVDVRGRKRRTARGAPPPPGNAAEPPTSRCAVWAPTRAFPRAPARRCVPPARPPVMGGSLAPNGSLSFTTRPASPRSGAVPDDRGCETGALMDSFGIFLQGLLGVVAFSTLMRESPRSALARPPPPAAPAFGARSLPSPSSPPLLTLASEAGPSRPSSRPLRLPRPPASAREFSFSRPAQEHLALIPAQEPQQSFHRPAFLCLA